MRLSISHTTHYSFSQPAFHGLQRLRLKPKTTHGQRIVAWTMQLDGLKSECEYEDQHHNSTVLASVEPDITDIRIVCTGVVETADNAGVIGRHTGLMPMWAFLNQTPLTRPGARMQALCAPLARNESNPLDKLHDLSRRVMEAVRYDAGYTDADTPAEDAVAAGHGVCQDHAHVFIGCARMLGIPARYVSGYLMMDDRIDQEAGHGWAEAHVDGLGWVGFDVSNAMCPDARYVRIASGCDYREAAPVTGISYGAGQSILSVSLAVEQQLAEQ